MEVTPYSSLILVYLFSAQGTAVVEEGEIIAADGDQVFAAGNDSDFFALEDAKNLEQLKNMKNDNMVCANKTMKVFKLFV